MGQRSRRYWATSERVSVCVCVCWCDLGVLGVNPKAGVQDGKVQCSHTNMYSMEGTCTFVCRTAPNLATFDYGDSTRGALLGDMVSCIAMTQHLEWHLLFLYVALTVS